MSAKLDKQLADLIERSKQTDRRIEQIRTDELRQLISDVNDANLYGFAQLEERIDELERRIEKLERRMDGKDDMDGEMLLAIGKRLCAVERKLNHKGGGE